MPDTRRLALATGPRGASGRRLEWLALAACALLFVAHAALYWSWLEDDAFISLRYADNLARGQGLVFNPGERVEGFSNPLWVLVEAVLRFGPDPLVWMRLLGIAAGVLCLPVAWRLARALRPGSSGWALLAPVYLAVSPVLVRHSVSGLETSLFALLAAGGLLLALRPPAGQRPAALAAVLLLLAATRAEGPALAIALALIPHVRARWGAPEAAHTPEAGPAHGATPSPWPVLIVLGGCAFGLAWRWSYYGSLVPNTYQAKMTGVLGADIDGVQYALGFLRDNGGGLLLGLALAPLLGSRRLDRVQVTVGVAVAYVAFVVAAGGDWMRHYRLFAHALPILAALAGAGAVAVARFAAEPAGRRRISALLAGVVAVSLLAGADREQQVAREILPALRAGTYLVQKYAEVGSWLGANSAPGATVAVSDIGAIGYYSRRTVIDMYGLTDPHIARRPGKPHDKCDPEYVLSRKPDWVVLVESTADPGQYSRLPDAALSGREGFRRAYEPFRELPMADYEVIKLYRRRADATEGAPPAG